MIQVFKNSGWRKLDSNKGTEINGMKILGLVIHQYFNILSSSLYYLDKRNVLFFILESGIYRKNQNRVTEYT